MTYAGTGGAPISALTEREFAVDACSQEFGKPSRDHDSTTRFVYGVSFWFNRSLSSIRARCKRLRMVPIGTCKMSAIVSYF